MSGSPRENVGKKDARRNRKEGRVPCVIYGGEEQLHFTMDEKEFGKLIFTPETYLVKLSIGEKEFTAILQDVQYHPVSDHVLHADFLEVMEGKPLVTALPLQFTGTSKGVLRGGRLIKKFRKLKVKGMLKDLPDLIEIDITKLNIGQSILVRDMKRDNITFLDPENAVIVGVKTARVVVAAEDEEEAEGGAEGAESSEEGEAPAEN